VVALQARGFIALGVLVMVSGLAPLIFTGTCWFLPWTGVIGLVIAVLGGNMKRRSPEAAELAAKYEAVKNYLTTKNIEKNRVYTEGKGEKQPVADNKTKEGKAKNRRVEVEVVGTRTRK